MPLNSFSTFPSAWVDNLLQNFITWTKWPNLCQLVACICTWPFPLCNHDRASIWQHTPSFFLPQGIPTHQQNKLQPYLHSRHRQSSQNNAYLKEQEAYQPKISEIHRFQRCIARISSICTYVPIDARNLGREPRGPAGTSTHKCAGPNPIWGQPPNPLQSNLLLLMTNFPTLSPSFETFDTIPRSYLHMLTSRR